MDFIHGNRLVMGSFGVIVTPFFMFWISYYSEELFEVPTPTEHYSYEFFRLISFLQGLCCIPILFIKGRVYKTIWYCFNRFAVVLILIGAAPWLMIFFMSVFGYTEYNATLIWFYCLSNLFNMAYWMLFLLKVSGIKPASFFES